MSDNIDLTSKVITFLFHLPGEKRMDLRIAMALLEKVIIFLLFFFAGGESRFSFFDYSLSLIGWLIMHVQIVVNEMGYIRYGENNLERRYYFFKVADFLQMGIVLLYFTITIHVQDLVTPVNSLMLYVTLIDQGMNITQFVSLGDIRPPKGEEQIPYQGGYSLFFFGAFVGSAFSYYIASVLLKFSQNTAHQSFPFYPAFLWCGIIGEIAFMLYSILYFAEQIKTARRNITNTQRQTSKIKYLLSFSYGLCIGVFNIYYAIILGMYCVYKIIEFIYKCYQEIKNPNTRVTPV